MSGSACRGPPTVPAYNWEGSRRITVDVIFVTASHHVEAPGGSFVAALDIALPTCRRLGSGTHAI